MKIASLILVLACLSLGAGCSRPTTANAPVEATPTPPKKSEGELERQAAAKTAEQHQKADRVRAQSMAVEPKMDQATNASTPSATPSPTHP